MRNKKLQTLLLSAVTIISIASTQAHESVLTGASPDIGEGKTDAICYIKLANGEVRDLTKLCGFIKPQSCSGSLGSASRDRVLAEFCQQNEKCLLTNTCNTQPIAPYGPRPGEAAG